MSLAEACLWITSLWLVIYAVKYASRRPKVLLPITRRPTTEISVKRLTIRLQTEVLNVFHDKLSTWLSPNISPFARQVLLKWYDLGSFAGVIGMLLAFWLLFLTAASLSSELLHSGRDHNASVVTKRGLDSVGTTPPLAPAPDPLRINAIIPGLTVPLSHLPLILVALVISQIAHESGHAIAAALHRIPMVSCGIAATFLFPSAFVILPAARLEKLPPRDRLQIVSGGCFHNITFLCLLCAAAWSRAGSFLTWTLFQDVSTQGRIVISVDYDLPLAAHVPVGTLITKLDDTSMASVSSDNPWDYFLLSSPPDPVRGWCADDSLLNEAFTPVCTSVDGSYSCFVSNADTAVQYELDPVRVFTDNLPRCNSSTECLSQSSCVVPRSDQQLVRISVLRDHAGTSVEDVVIWKGPKEEIWEQVRVGNLRSRVAVVVPPELPELASTFFEYMRMANLSLYLVNMLPIMPLDGYQSLVTVLQLLYGRVGHGSESIDLESLQSTTRSGREGRVQRVCRTFLSFLALLLVALCGLLATIRWARE